MLTATNAPRVNVNSVNFAVNVGVPVPSHVNVVSVSTFPALIDVFPAYRDYSFFVVEDEIVFLDRDRRVVDVVPAGPRTRFSRSSAGGDAAALNLSEPEIRQVQQVLIERGLLTGEVDGVLGPRTEAALVTFQRQQGIQTTGRIDTHTVDALGLSSRIGQQTGQSTTGSIQSSTMGQSQTGTQQQQPSAQQNTTGQTSGQANAPMPQNPSTTGQAQGGAQQQQPAQQNTQAPAQPQNATGQAAPQNQSTVGQAGNQPGTSPNMPSSSPATSGQGTSGQGTSGQGNAPAQNPVQNPSEK